MKRFSALLLALACALTMTACGGVTAPAATPAPTAAPASTAPAPETDPAAGPGESVPPDGDTAPAPDGAPEPPAEPTQEPAETAPLSYSASASLLGITRENLPRLDGSTSTAPLALALCEALLGETEAEASELIDFHKTTNAYMNLLYGLADLLIVGEANGEVYEKKEEFGFAWEQDPFATDAFVFVVNEDNPVESITIDQARDIYTGRITNWKELGGEDREIIPLQRNQGAGSQTLMEKLVMRGEPMMEAPVDYVVMTMGELMSAVKSYDSSPGAIGYSVYYYAEEMKMARGLKLLRLEGVEPNPDTIRGEEYPLLNPKYVVIPADAPEGSPSRVIRDWLLSVDGQRLIAAEGYVSIMDLPVTPKVTPRVGSRRYPEFTDALIPQKDYGRLVPYAGQRLAEDWPSENGCLYGLMTVKGEVVTDPVFTAVFAPAYNGSDAWRHLPLLMMERAAGPQRKEYAVCAADGSWCTGFDWTMYAASRSGLALFSDQSLTLMDPQGTIQAELPWSTLEVSDTDLERSYREFMDGMGWAGDRMGYFVVLYQTESGSLRYLNYISGETGEMSADEWSERKVAETVVAGEEPLPAPELGRDQSLVRDSILDGGPSLVVTSQYVPGAGRSGAAPRYVRRCSREDGAPLPMLNSASDAYYQRVGLEAGLMYKIDLNTASYYDLETLACVFRTSLGYESD